MRKTTIWKFLVLVSALLAGGFAVHTVIDACRYDRMLTSFPFYAYILVHALEYLVPGLLVLIVALIVKKKFANTAN